MINDPNFQKWLQLYNSNIKEISEYKNLYQNLRNRYGETPISVVKKGI